MGSYANAHNQAQVLSFRLDRLYTSGASGPEPVPTWLAAAPPLRQSAPRWSAYLTARYDEMAHRISALVTDQQTEPWAARVGHGELRDAALRQVAAYRSVFDVSDADPLGPEPVRHTRQHEGWTAATLAIRLACAATSPSGPRATRVTHELTPTIDLTEQHRPHAFTAPGRHI